MRKNMVSTGEKYEKELLSFLCRIIKNSENEKYLSIVREKVEKIYILAFSFLSPFNIV